jgi:HSP20 family protein
VSRNEDLSLMNADATWWPKLEIVKRDRCLVARLALREMAKDDLSVFVDEGGLVVEGERQCEIEYKRGDQRAMAPGQAKFRRPIPLTDGVSPEDVKATFTAGVLELTVPAPSAAATRQPRKVSKRSITIGPEQEAGKTVA